MRLKLDTKLLARDRQCVKDSRTARVHLTNGALLFLVTQKLLRASTATIGRGTTTTRHILPNT